jgi:hypothetical protein
MGNTGYKSFETLELYFTDDGSYAGKRKPNVVTDPDYVAPVLDVVTCAPSTRYYNAEKKMNAIRNNCDVGYIGSNATLTAYANQFVSNIDEADANTQAEVWLTANVQAHANSSGICEFNIDTTDPTCPCSGCIGAEKCYTVTLTAPFHSENIGVKHTNHLGVNKEGPLTSLEAMDNIDGTYTYKVCSTTAPVFYSMSNYQEILWDGGSFSLASCGNH